MARGLTGRQRVALDLVARHFLAYGYPPTQRELADLMGIRSINAAWEYLRTLTWKGYLERPPGVIRSRGVRLTPKAWEELGMGVRPAEVRLGRRCSDPACAAHYFGPSCPFCPPSVVVSGCGGIPGSPDAD